MEDDYIKQLIGEQLYVESDQREKKQRANAQVSKLHEKKKPKE